MRKLTEEESDNILKQGYGRHCFARAILLNMKVGEIILLERHEWNQKTNTPAELIRRIRKSKHWDYSCFKALDGSGWIIKRLK